MRFSLRWLLALCALVVLCADAEAGVFRHRGKSACASGSCQSAPAAVVAAPVAPKVEAAPLTVTGSSCAGGSCSAPTATVKRGLFGFRR